MARIIKSIFNSNAILGDTEAKRQQSLMAAARGAQSQPYNQIGGAAAGLIGNRLRQEFFPSEGEQASEIMKNESLKLAQVLDPSKYPEEFKLELGNRLAQIGNQQGNQSLLASGVDLIQKTNQGIREGRAKRVQDRKAEVELQQANRALRRQESIDEYAAKGGMGAIPDREGQDKFKSDLRAEYISQTEAFMTRRTGMEAVRALANQGTRQAHLKLVIASLKVLEPNSAVLTEEQKIATNTAEVRQRLQTYLNMLEETKGNLTPEQVAEIVTSTEAVYSEFRKITADYHQNAKALYDTKIPNGDFNLEIAPQGDIPEALTKSQQEYIELYEKVEDRNKAAADLRAQAKALEGEGAAKQGRDPILPIMPIINGIANMWHNAKEYTESRGESSPLTEQAVPTSTQEVGQQEEVTELEKQLLLLQTQKKEEEE